MENHKMWKKVIEEEQKMEASEKELSEPIQAIREEEEANAKQENSDAEADEWAS